MSDWFQSILVAPLLSEVFTSETFKSQGCADIGRDMGHTLTLAPAVNTELMAELIATIIALNTNFWLFGETYSNNRQHSLVPVEEAKEIFFFLLLVYCVWAAHEYGWGQLLDTLYSFFAIFASLIHLNHEGELGRADIWSFRRLFPPRPRVRKIFSFLCPFSNNYIYIFSKDPVLRFFSFIFLSNHRGNWVEIIVLSKIIRPLK